jgi:hypothetical protein
MKKYPRDYYNYMIYIIFGQIQSKTTADGVSISPLYFLLLPAVNRSW